MTELYDLLQFETLIEHLDAEGVVNVCKLNKQYASLCSERKVWVTLLKKHYGVSPTYDPRQEYIDRKKYKLNREYFEAVPVFSGEYPLTIYPLPHSDHSVHMKTNIAGITTLFKHAVNWQIVNDTLNIVKIDGSVFATEWKPEFQALTTPWVEPLGWIRRETGLNMQVQINEDRNIKILGYNLLNRIYQFFETLTIVQQQAQIMITMIMFAHKLGFIEPNDDLYLPDPDLIQLFYGMKRGMKIIHDGHGYIQGLPIPEMYQEMFGQSITLPLSPGRRSYRVEQPGLD